MSYEYQPAALVDRLWQVIGTSVLVTDRLSELKNTTKTTWLYLFEYSFFCKCYILEAEVHTLIKIQTFFPTSLTS